MTMAGVFHSPWFWWALALALFTLEALLPGAFMLWLGFAATGTALVLLVLPLGVPLQWVLFSVLALVSIALGWRYRNKRGAPASDQPLLNRRGEQLVGQVYVLETAIIDGRGRVKIGDAFWAVQGPDLPVGTRVRVFAVDGMRLKVQLAP